MSGHGNRRTAFEVASFKAMDDKAGEFEALVSVFGNVDRGGDRVVKGAFTKSLNRWREKGDPIPVIWNHMWENPEAHIGAVAADDAQETDDGLLVKGRVDLDNPFARQVYRLLSERRVKEFSFGYDLKDSERKDGALELREIDLFELGPTLKGMNTETELLAVKALAQATAFDESEAQLRDRVNVMADTERMLQELKAGARHSRETRSIVQSVVDALHGHFLTDGQPSDDETPKSTEAEAEGKASDPDADLRTKLQLAKDL